MKRSMMKTNDGIKQGRNTMEQQTGSATTATPLSAFPVDLVGMGKKRLQALFDAQSKLVDTLPALSREWMSAAQAERELSSELLAKLAAARTLPESARAYQEWLSRRIDMFADETRMLLADTQKLVDVGARLFAIEQLGSGNGAAPPEPRPGAETH
jgi:phasin protein